MYIKRGFQTFGYADLYKQKAFNLKIKQLSSFSYAIQCTVRRIFTMLIYLNIYFCNLIQILTMINYISKLWSRAILLYSCELSRYILSIFIQIIHLLSIKKKLLLYQILKLNTQYFSLWI